MACIDYIVFNRIIVFLILNKGPKSRRLIKVLCRCKKGTKGEKMSFDECREDVIEGYPCDCGGSVTKSIDGERWECDSCDFEANIEKEHNQTVPSDKPLN